MLRWQVFVVSVVVAASVAGCGRLSFDFDGRGPGDDHTPSQASIDRFELTPARFSANGSVFVPVPGSEIELGPRSAGRPWILWLSATLGSTTVTEMSVEVRYTVNAVERGYGGVQNLVADQRGSFHHFVAVDTSDGPAAFELELRDLAGGTATIDQLRIVGFVAPPGADVHYAEVNPPLPIPTTSYAEYHRVSVTPSAPGRYLVFAAVAASETPSTAADVEVRWVEDATGTVFPSFGRYMNVRQPWQTFTGVMLVDIPDTTPRSVRLEALARTAGGLRGSHLLAMRADAFGDVLERTDPPERVVANGQTVVTSELAVPAATDAAYVVVQSVRLYNACPGTLTRQARFEIDAAITTTVAHAIDNCAYQPGYGSVSLVERNTAFVVRNVVAPTMGQTIYATDSYIYVLRLPATP